MRSIKTSGNNVPYVLVLKLLFLFLFALWILTPVITFDSREKLIWRITSEYKQDGFPDSSVREEFTSNSGDPGSVPGSGRFAGEGIGYPVQYSLASLVSQLVKNLPAMWETWYCLPVVMYGCESWTIKKAEHWRIDAFELQCWRGLLRVPWTARRSNLSILKEISP